MKKLLVLFTLLTIIACTESKKYDSFGEKITAKSAKETSEIYNDYKSLNEGDTLSTKFKAVVTDVCKSKGCWMKLQLEDNQEVMVKFKDYGFFVPKDIEGKEVIVNGKAFVNSMSVDEQRHYAEDAGQSPEEIAKITTPKKTYSFEADGVLIAQ